MKIITNYIICLFCTFGFIMIGCAEQQERISQEKFVDIMLDIHRHSKALQYTVNELTPSAASIDSLGYTVAQAILDTHHVTQEAFSQTIQYYKTHTTEMLNLLTILKAKSVVVETIKSTDSQE